MLVNNAGALFAFEPSEWDPAVFEDSVRINLFGALRMASACRPLLNVASMSAFRAAPFVPGYGAAKSGIVQPGLVASNMTKAMQVHLGDVASKVHLLRIGRNGNRADRRSGLG